MSNDGCGTQLNALLPPLFSTRAWLFQVIRAISWSEVLLPPVGLTQQEITEVKCSTNANAKYLQQISTGKRDTKHTLVELINKQSKTDIGCIARLFDHVSSRTRKA